MNFQGETYVAEHDEKRLTRQLDRVREYMLMVSHWHTLREIELSLDYPQASISARLRDLRKEGLIVERRRRGEAKKGIHEYRVSKPNWGKGEQMRLIA